jgi:hypothetical protein
MAKKSWVDKAAKSGNWKDAENKARAALKRSGQAIRAQGAAIDRPETIRRFEGLEPDAPEPADPSDDPVQEFVENVPDEDVDVLPDDEQEKALTTTNTRPVVTLAQAYAEYREKGGNRALDQRALYYLGTTNIERIDRSFVVEAARRLYPTRSRSEHATLLYEPLDEILGGLAPPKPGSDGWWAERKRKRDAEYEAQLQIYYERQDRLWEMMLASLAGDEKRMAELEELGCQRPRIIPEEDFWRDIDARDSERRNDWASATPYSPGPPSDPPPPRYTGSLYVTGTPGQWSRYKNRSVLSKLKLNDGTELSFGYAPSHRHACVFEQTVYIGYLPGKTGRPRKPDKLSRAEIQKAYRDRHKGRKD